jgi:L-alanine-DL-glutamate epimerase-like enolase superfamily enzyme
MKITRLKTAVVEGNFDWTFVRLETDTGLRGLGECFFAPGLTAMLRDLEPVILGEDPRDVRRLFRKLQWAASGAGSVAGCVYNAITGIEAALWDIVGQALGAPIYQVLGGKFRDQVRIYADCHGGEGLESLDSVLRSRSASWANNNGSHKPSDYFGSDGDEPTATPEMYAKRAAEMAVQGFTALKFDIDVPNPHRRDPHNRSLGNEELDYMLSLIAAARKTVGLSVDIAVDCHWRFNLADARRIAAGCEPFKLLWLEDALPPWSVDGFRELKLSSNTPISTGENLYLFEGFRSLIQKECLSVVSPDLQKVGGLTEARRIAEYADSYNVGVAPHNISSPIGTMASAHFCAAIPNFLALEYHASEVPFWDDLVADRSETGLINKGYIAVPEKPGLGITLNEEVARRYARDDEPFFE